MCKPAARHALGLLGSLADLLARHVPDVRPVVFDGDRTRQWAEMVDGATCLDSPTANAHDPIPYTLTDKAMR